MLKSLKRHLHSIVVNDRMRNFNLMYRFKKIKVLLLFLSLCLSLEMLAQRNEKNVLPLGVFDSGTGGLTVLEAILQLDAYNNQTGDTFPDGIPDFVNETYQYLADQANMPYGNYAAAGKTDLLKEHMVKNFLFFAGNAYDKPLQNDWVAAAKPSVKMIVLACNTATAYTLTDLRTMPQSGSDKIPVIGVIEAGAKAALKYLEHHEGTVGVFATAGTVASNGYPLTLQEFADAYNVKNLSIVSQGGVGIAESIDNDAYYINDTVTVLRTSYKGPSITNEFLSIDTALLNVYNFNRNGNALLCETDEKGGCLDMQLNDPSNYVRYHLVSLLEKMKLNGISRPLNTLILGCTHYPYLKDTIQSVLTELYNFKSGGDYLYRNVISANVQLIDPAIETAKEAWCALFKEKLLSPSKSNHPDLFFITVPNTKLQEVQLQTNGSFSYEYKYGRIAGGNKKYVQTELFSNKNISTETYLRLKKVLPAVYSTIVSATPDLQ